MISNYSVKKPYTVIVGVVMVLLLGVISFTNSTTDLLPEIELPMAVVYTTYPGASAEKVESEVTRPIEQAIATTENLISMTSTSSDNLSMIILEFADDTNMDSALLALSGNIDLVEGNLNEMVMAPTILAINPNMMPIMTATIDVEGLNIQELSDYVDHNILQELEKIPGVASISTTGIVEETVQIVLEQDKINEINLAILNSVDSDLADAQVELQSALNDVREALNEINSQQGEFDTTKENTLNELAQTSVGLQEAATNLIAMDAQIIQLEAEKAAFTAIVDGFTQLEGSLNSAIALQSGVSVEITRVSSLSGEIPIDDLAPQVLVSQIGVLFPEVLQTPVTTYEAYNQLLATQSVVLQGMVSELQAQYDQLSPQIPDAQSRLTQLPIEIETAKAIKQQVSDVLVNSGIDVSDLSTVQSQIESGLAQAGNEFAVGEVTIANTKESLEAAELELEAGLEELEIAREDALEAANISSFLSSSMIAQILQAEDFSLPAGYIASNEDSILVKVGDEFASIEEINQLLIMPIELDGLSNVYLSDIATIQVVDDSSEIYTRVNGNNAIMVSFQKTSTASTAEVSDAIHEAFVEIQEEHPELNYTALMDQGVYIDLIVSSVLSNFLYGGVLAVIVLILFLKDSKPTFVIGLSIPISLMFTLVLMYFSDITLNIISLSGLALGVGMLVDNSVVVVENIYRLRSEGVPLMEASIKGAKQVSGAIIASTLTTVSVFLPIVFATGITRQLFVDMGLTIGYSLLASLIVALTVVPMLSSKMLNKQPVVKKGFFTKMVDLYEGLLKWTLSHRFVVLLITGCMFVGTMLMITQMGMVLIPEMGSEQITMNVSLSDPTATFDQSIEVYDDILNEISMLEQVETAGASVGSSMFGMGASNDATFYILVDNSKISKEVSEQLSEITAKYPVESSVSTSSMDMSALSGEGITIQIYGDDLDELNQSASQLATQLEQFEGISEVSDGLENPVEELRIQVDKNNAMAYGLTVAQVYQAVSEAISTENASTSILLNGKEVDILVLKDEGELVNVDSLNSLVLEGQKDNEAVDVVISEIATISEGVGAQSINRDNSRRYMTVTASIEEGYNVSLVSRNVETALDLSNLPDSVEVEFAGENETIMETMIVLAQMIALAIAFIYMIMVAQFQSLLSPFIVLFTIPLAFTGGLLALMITGFDLSIVATLGFLVLSGVVVNNGIVFIDYVNQLIEEGASVYDALIETGKTRIRPILMTALTTILAMTTMALGIGDGAEMMQGMAIVTIGGLSYATVLTLFIVPIIYSLFHREKKTHE